MKKSKYIIFYELEFNQWLEQDLPEATCKSWSQCVYNSWSYVINIEKLTYMKT